jgi:hypothetical protein
MAVLSMSSTVEVNEKLVFRSVDSEGVLIDSVGGAYSGLGVVGARIWSLLQEGQSLQNIVQALRIEFDCSDEECTNDLLAFLEDLIAKGLLTEVEGPLHSS